jgi:PAS domain S-box-containing protein
MDVIIILAISFLLQLIAAFLALRLIRVTGQRITWIMIATAIFLMAIRRSISLFRMLLGENYLPDLSAELVALFTSALMVVGIALIAPLFLSIRRSEDSQRKINRALRMLSSVNQVIIRSTEESALLKDACRTIVEGGGYRMVWVGFAEQDEEKTVRPVAQAGYEEGYLDSLDITWADTERGRGPTGKAIRTGKPCTAKNILTDPDYAPWRDEANRRGYASSVSIPLIAKNQTLGALSMYAEEPDTFDTEEVNLLTELADDLAYGIMALRARIESERTEEALRASEEKYKTLFESAGEGILIADIETKEFKYANPAICKMLGYSEEQLPRLGVSDIHSKDALEHVISEFEAQARGEKTLAIDIPCLRKDGTIIYADINTTKILLDGKECNLGFFTDITERKRVEDALRKNDEELKRRVNELEEFYDMAVGRELRMSEFKEEIESLKDKLSRYKKVDGVQDA